MSTRSRTAVSPEAAPARSPIVLLWLLVAVGLVLAGSGVLLSGVVLRGNGQQDADQRDAVIGQPLSTSFGSLTVTRVATTFVPDTQGPPTADQHNGAHGHEQLQVWVRLVNSGSSSSPYSPDQFQLITAAGSATTPAGSSLTTATLPGHTSIDGQVWFDLGAKASAEWVEFADGSGQTVRIRVSGAPVSEEPEHEHD